MKPHLENNFDFLRLFAAVLVVFSHCFPLAGRDYEPFSLATQVETGGGYAVAIFFVISGFLITGSYFSSTGAISYFKKRVLRIYPAFAVSILFCLFIIGPIFTTLPVGSYFTHPDSWRFLKSLRLFWLVMDLPGVFQSNPHHSANGVYWTLPMEFTMYILLFFIGMAGMLRPRIVFGLVAGFYGLHFYLFTQYDPTSAGKIFHMPAFFLTRSAALFFAGSLLYFYKDQIRQQKPWIALLLLAMAAVSCLDRSWGYPIHFLLMPYLIIYIALQPLPLLKNAGRHGDFSYGIYLYAFPVQQAIIALWGTSIGILPYFLLTMAVTLPLAILSWRLVEAPALAYKGRKPLL